MESLVNAEKGKWQELDDTLTQLKQECDQLNTQLTEFSAGVPGLQDEYNELERSELCHVSHSHDQIVICIIFNKQTSCKCCVSRRIRMLLNVSKSSHVKICHRKYDCF